eukprot:752563-Hanusia_phi.AAC.3
MEQAASARAPYQLRHVAYCEEQQHDSTRRCRSSSPPPWPSLPRHARLLSKSHSFQGGGRGTHIALGSRGTN